MRADRRAQLMLPRGRPLFTLLRLRDTHGCLPEPVRDRVTGSPSGLWTNVGQVETLHPCELPALGVFGRKASSVSIEGGPLGVLAHSCHTAHMLVAFAFAKVVEHFSAFFWGVRYHAGLWEGGLVEHLHWFV